MQGKQGRRTPATRSSGKKMATVLACIHDVRCRLQNAGRGNSEKKTGKCRRKRWRGRWHGRDGACLGLPATTRTVVGGAKAWPWLPGRRGQRREVEERSGAAAAPGGSHGSLRGTTDGEGTVREEQREEGRKSREEGHVPVCSGRGRHGQSGGGLSSWLLLEDEGVLVGGFDCRREK